MPVLLTLFSHWRRAPGQFATLILGLALATGLWSGVQAINQEARNSYANAAASLGATGFDRLVTPDGSPVPLADYVALRQAGWQVSPVIAGRLTLGDRRVQIIGVDPLTAPPGAVPLDLGDAGFSPAEHLIGQGVAFVADLPENVSVSGEFPRLIQSQAVAPGVMVTDIHVASRLLGLDDPSYLVLHPTQPRGLPDLSDVTSLIRQAGRGAEDLSRLTDSFHLNLTAFGFLSFAVGLFIVHATVGLAFEQRRPVFRTLRAIGVSLPQLIAALLVEVTLLALVAGAIGVVMGYAVAAALLPDVAGTLRSLYGAEISGTLAFRPLWAAVGLCVAIGGAWLSSAQSLWKVANMPILAPAQPRAWAMASVRAIRFQFGASLMFFAASAAFAAWGTGLGAGFLCLGALLLGAALSLPMMLSLGLALWARVMRGPLAEWVVADARQQLPGLSLALMALMLALSANIGVSTMVGSFRETFLGWLNQRLVSELYLRAADNEEADQIRSFLAPMVDATLPIAYAESTINGLPGRVYGIVDHVTYRDNWPLLETVSDVWTRLQDGEVALVNEQLSYRDQLAVGDLVELAPGLTLPIGGIYSDYGNPNGQVMVSLSLLDTWFPVVTRNRIAVRVDPDRRPEIIAALNDAFALPPDAVVDQESLKQASIRVFEQTFRVTGALSVLTLAVAAFALLASLLTLSRMRLPQIAPLWALGERRSRLAWIDVLKMLGLVLLTWGVALPVGLALAWVLLAIVNVEAFGWRLPMHLYPLDWLRLLGLAVVSSALAAAWPAVVLMRTPPAQLLKVFSNER